MNPILAGIPGPMQKAPNISGEVRERGFGGKRSSSYHACYDGYLLSGGEQSSLSRAQ